MLLGIAALGELVRVKPVALALIMGVLVAVAIDPASLIVGIALAVVGGLLVLVALLGMATVLRWAGRHSGLAPQHAPGQHHQDQRHRRAAEQFE